MGDTPNWPAGYAETLAAARESSRDVPPAVVLAIYRALGVVERADYSRLSAPARAELTAAAIREGQKAYREAVAHAEGWGA